MSIIIHEFEYLDDKYRKMKARLTKAHFPSTPSTQSGTQDPLWEIFDPSLGHWTGPYEWLLLFGTDGTLWRTRVHAQYNGASRLCNIWMTSKGRDTGAGENPTLEIVDWQGKKWHLDITNPIPNDSAPTFTKTPSKAA